MVQVNLSTASRALALPSLMASRRSRMSLESSLTPSSPDFLLTTISSRSAASVALEAVSAILCRMKSRTPGSMSPVREPLMMPPVGVKPIDVSRHWPLRIALMEAPLPRWATMSFSGTLGSNW